jgi:hypothetical protein
LHLLFQSGDALLDLTLPNGDVTLGGDRVHHAAFQEVLEDLSPAG